MLKRNPHSIKITSKTVQGLTYPLKSIINMMNDMDNCQFGPHHIKSYQEIFQPLEEYVLKEDMINLKNNWKNQKIENTDRPLVVDLITIWFDQVPFYQKLLCQIGLINPPQEVIIDLQIVRSINNFKVISNEESIKNIHPKERPQLQIINGGKAI